MPMYRILPVLFVVLALVAPQAARAEDVIAACPLEWRFGNELLPLRWAELWADYQDLTPTEGDQTSWPGGSIARWDLTKVSRRPLFLKCDYTQKWGGGLP